MPRWTTWWAHAQRGMGLEKQCSKKVEITIHDIVDCNQIRFQFAASYDNQPITIKNAYCFIKDHHQKYPLTFQGELSYQITPEAIITSDELCIEITSRQTVGLVYEIETKNDYQCASGFKLKPNDYVCSKDSFVYLVKSIEVYSSSLKGCICAFGDSITEQGYWSEPLSKQLRNKGYALLLLGISGNRLLRDLENVTISPFKQLNKIPLSKQCFGKAGIKRFKEDVLSCHNIAGVIIGLGVNDLYQPGTFCADGNELPNIEDMLDGYLTLKEAIPDTYIWVLGITPFLGAEGSTLVKEKVRCQLNQLLGQYFPQLITFDDWLMAENHQIKREYHNGDYLHPNQKAGSIMALLIFNKMEV